MIIYTAVRTWKDDPRFIVEAYTLHRNEKEELQCVRCRIPKGIEVPTFDPRWSNFLMACDKVEQWAKQQGFVYWTGLYTGRRWYGDVSDIELLACLAHE